MLRIRRAMKYAAAAVELMNVTTNGGKRPMPSTGETGDHHADHAHASRGRWNANAIRYGVGLGRRVVGRAVGGNNSHVRAHRNSSTTAKLAKARAGDWDNAPRSSPRSSSYDDALV